VQEYRKEGSFVGERAAAKEIAMNAESATLPESTVLIIDDTPANLAVMMDFLEALGLRILTAQDGEEGLKRAELVRPDIILLDVVMPGLDGFEVARRLKNSPTLRDTPIIFMTALTDSREKIRGFEVGGVDYVTKPLQIEEVRARVMTHLRLHAAQKQLAARNADLQAEMVLRAAAAEQLRAAVEDLESFSYSVSHDLRAPLRAIDNFTNILLKGSSDRLDDEGKRLFNLVRKNAKTMSQLINDMLAFARAGRQELVLSEVDLEALTRDIWHDLNSVAAGRNIRMEIGAVPKIRADPAAMRVVISNLLHNAVKFTRSRDIAIIQVGGEVVDDNVACFVKDNGVGFDPQYLHKLFGVFQRLHHASEFEGTGVGLGIVKRIVDKHGGRVWAEGFPEKGATFHFSLPLRS
jgi:two-component system, sensor histidine kinase and response regulator